MKYMGSKRRLARDILATVNLTWGTVWIEPFVGGANMIDKVPHRFNRVGYDKCQYLIAYLQGLQSGWLPPKNKQEFTEEAYNAVKQHHPSDNWALVGFAGYAVSYGAKWFGGWPRDAANSRDYVNEAYKNAVKQAPKLQHISFQTKEYSELTFSDNSDTADKVIVYCDPPYKGTTGYKDSFNHEEFYSWVRQISNLDNILVYVSEYTMPDDFTPLWDSPKLQASSLDLDTGGKLGKENLWVLTKDLDKHNNRKVL